MRDAPYTPAGEVSDDTLWESLARFMERVVPVAAEAGVKLALHPDDPPISPIRGMARILRTPEAMRRAIDMVPSPYNGITMCQGNFARWGPISRPRSAISPIADALHFVHFRDVRGTPERFVETFHDDGQTDMFAACGPTGGRLRRPAAPRPRADDGGGGATGTGLRRAGPPLRHRLHQGAGRGGGQDGSRESGDGFRANG